jgi:hypothetical protein
VPTRPAPSHPTTGRDHTHDRVRRDRIDTDGKVTLRVNGRLHHIGIDPARDYQPIHLRQPETTSPRTHNEGSG